MNKNIENMKIHNKTKIGVQNEYIAEILQERNQEVINTEEIAHKITKNKTLIEYTEEFIVANNREKNDL